MRSYGRLTEKVAIITGASSGIGKATALLFALEGAKVVLADVNEGALQEIVSKIGQDGGTALAKKTDVSVESEVKALIDFTLEEFGQVDILCNNAGITGDHKGHLDDDAENWQQVYGVNVVGAMLGIKHVAEHMQSRNQGAIVNTASVAGIRAGAGTNAYSASKAALINFTQTAACDLGQFNVRVNAVCPGLTETGMTQPIFDMARDAGKEHKLGSRCELRRYGKPEELAQAILFLASDDASYITGQALAVDGGNTASLNLPNMKF
ncbi:MAG: SDR family oxidoreductase [Deltaproteobacteria bacterium]|nr:SDR family oxidoreductase [Deltaproteobacteria bacterium]MBT4263212.1 SDR family oxidoreductase [Deltaproteobacteria bacterium]MBT4640960.1 SDR family oxidoreductase [Deltaproteobacteria bacterium]MBT6611644.1 SDR family oxidoreductase [Deltaproteobacteria bacterium]MBT7156016.1 SDR family oxidoreductase [Deltaproteobacteria bacterium]